MHAELHTRCGAMREMQITFPPPPVVVVPLTPEGGVSVGFGLLGNPDPPPGGEEYSSSMATRKFALDVGRWSLGPRDVALYREVK